MAELSVTVGADIDGVLVAAKANTVTIPPQYAQRDIDALAVRVIEDTAFAAVQEAYGRQPTKRALLAVVARLRAVEDALGRFPDGEEFLEHRSRIQAILALTNDEAIAQWGENPEGQ